MPTLSQELKKISRELKNFLPSDNAEAKQQVKSIFKVIALRFGSDLLPRQIHSLSQEQKKWLRDQIEQILSVFSLDSSVSEEVRMFFYTRLTALSQSLGKILSTERNILVGSVYKSEKEVYDGHVLSLQSKKSKNQKLSWTTIATTGALAAHAGFFAYSAVGTASTATLVGFGTALLSAIGTGLVWLVDQTRNLLSKIHLAGSSALLPIKIAGIALYAALMLPFILRTLYKNFRNIFSAKYAEKRWDSLARLFSSLVLAGAGVALGLVAGMFGWGGGPLVALGLAALGWGIGHSVYKWYKRSRDAKIHFGKTNPQATRFTQAQLKAVLDKVPAAKPSLATRSQNQINAAQNQVMDNVVNLVQALEKIITEEKQSRRAYRSLKALGLAIIKALWGFHFRTPREHAAKEALRDLKRGNLDMLKARCKEGLGIALNLEDFSMGERGASAAPVEWGGVGAGVGAGTGTGTGTYPGYPTPPGEPADAAAMGLDGAGVYPSFLPSGSGYYPGWPPEPTLFGYAPGSMPPAASAPPPSPATALPWPPSVAPGQAPAPAPAPVPAVLGSTEPDDPVAVGYTPVKLNFG